MKIYTDEQVQTFIDALGPDAKKHIDKLGTPSSIMLGEHQHKHGTDVHVLLVKDGASFDAERYGKYLGDEFEPENDEEIRLNMAEVDSIFAEITHGSELDTKICFAVGELDMDSLEETASFVNINFDKWTSDDELRAQVIDAAREHGGLKIYSEKGLVSTLGFDGEGDRPSPEAEGVESLPSRPRG